MSQGILWGAVVLLTALLVVSIRVAIVEAAGVGLRSVVFHPLVLFSAGILGNAIANAAEALPDLVLRLLYYPSLALALAGCLGLLRLWRRERKARL